MADRKERARRASSTLGRILRYIGLIIGIVIGWSLGLAIGPSSIESSDQNAYAIMMAAAVGALLFVLTPYITFGLFTWLGREIRQLEISDILAAAAGFLLGGLISTLVAIPVAMLPDPAGSYLPFIFALVICAISILAFVMKKRELLRLIGRGRDAAEIKEDDTPPAPLRERDTVLLDTSAIIDGRVVNLVEQHFLRDDLVVPTAVLGELQGLGDSSDDSRRARGRRGLEMLERLRELKGDQLRVEEYIGATDIPVDDLLVRVARENGFLVLTGDQQMAHVASLQGVGVMNLHALGELVRPGVTSGDKLIIQIMQQGKEPGQGVGYLDDGSMVVVEEAGRLMGEQVEIAVTRTLRTSAGRLVFAQLAAAVQDEQKI